MQSPLNKPNLLTCGGVANLRRDHFKTMEKPNHAKSLLRGLLLDIDRQSPAAFNFPCGLDHWVDCGHAIAGVEPNTE